MLSSFAVLLVLLTWIVVCHWVDLHNSGIIWTCCRFLTTEFFLPVALSVFSTHLPGDVLDGVSTALLVGGERGDSLVDGATTTKLWWVHCLVLATRNLRHHYWHRMCNGRTRITSRLTRGARARYQSVWTLNTRYYMKYRTITNNTDIPSTFTELRFIFTFVFCVVLCFKLLRYVFKRHIQ